MGGSWEDVPEAPRPPLKHQAALTRDRLRSLIHVLRPPYQPQKEGRDQKEKTEAVLCCAELKTG